MSVAYKLRTDVEDKDVRRKHATRPVASIYADDPGTGSQPDHPVA